MLVANEHVLLAVAGVVLVIIGVVFFLRKKQQTANTFLLLGVSHSGKTALFTLLVHGSVVNTITSMKENEGTMQVLGSRTCELVDVPGHERMWHRYDDYLPITRGIVMVVDSTTVIRTLRPVAEYIYIVLAALQTQKYKIPVLIACNKSDMMTALPKEKIKLLLEGEINRLRDTRTAALERQASEGNDQEEEFLGFEDVPFEFEHVDSRVKFESCSVKKMEIDMLSCWISSV
ncbi:signal recognition particle receptor beta subunit-domain-containing protein [Spinellus fusiger]|nr:signal recognition particle receptor beta subunit-domain-containing protein [Spinellus fusiger]